MLRLSFPHAVLSIAAALFSIQLQAAPATSDTSAAREAAVDHPIAVSTKATSPHPQAQPVSPEDFIPASEIKEATSRPVAIAIKKSSPNLNVGTEEPNRIKTAAPAEEIITRPLFLVE